jgi:outer membrane protein W
MKMKKILMTALVIAALFNIHTANAQQGFSVSIKGIPQFSFLQNKNDKNSSGYNNKVTIAASFGIGADYSFDNHLGVGVDALYSLQGQRYTLNSIEYNQKVNYIKMPVYFIYSSNASKPISFIGKLGPQVGFVSDANFAYKNGNKIIADTKDHYKTTTFGAAALVGVQYKLSRQVFVSTALRFDHDFTNAENDNYSEYAFGRGKTYSSTVGLELGLKYMIK